jgi:hypothetical protein
VRGPNVSNLRGFFTGEREFPLWMRLFLVVPAVQVAVELYDRRGVAVAVVGGLVWATLLVWTVRGSSRTIAWARAHPGLDRALTAPLIFTSLAYLTRLELWWCALIGVAVWLSVVVLGRWRRRVVYRGRAGTR